MKTPLVSEVLATHDSYPVGKGQKEILGDLYLMQENSIYRNIRFFALQIGCKFAPAWPEYLQLPFHELGKIIKTKTVPYVPSARLLQNLENKRSGVLTVDDLQIPESYHLHESAHVIAEHLFQSVPLQTDQEKILKTIVCESFANTVDALVCLAVDDEVHEFFLRQNCYMRPQKKYIDTMKRLNQRLGFQGLFMLTLFAYLHSNFLQQSLSKETIQNLIARYSPKAEIKEKTHKDFQTLIEMSEKLDPLFRVRTTEVYFKLEGFDAEIMDLLNFSFLDVFESNSGFRQVTEAMSDILGKNHSEEPLLKPKI